MKKVFIIGLDGGPYKEVKEWIEAGELPFLSRMAKEGAFGKLKSIIPPFSMLAWPVISTGKNPAKIGPFLYKAKERGFNPDFFSSAQFINSTDIKTWSLWEWAGKFGMEVGVLNVPMTYPPVKVNGFMITGFLTPRGAENYTYPPELREELRGYRIKLKLKEGVGFSDKKINKKKLHRDFMELIEERTDWVLKFLNKYDPDLYMMNYKEMDDFMHSFWDRKDLLLEFFKKADKGIERIYEEKKPDYLMIISDHGFTDAPLKYYYINQYLENMGYLTRAGGAKGNFSNFVYKFGTTVVKRFGFVRNLFSEKFKLKIARESIKDKINWEMTKAYGNWYAGLYLNPRYYPDDLCKREGALELKNILLDAKDPDNGERIFLVAKTKWELFKGPYFDEMPDVVYTTTKDYRLNTNLPGILMEKRFARPSLTGHHTSALDGILFLKGKGVKEGVKLEASIQDVFPTACALAGVPIPADVDGKILKDILQEDCYSEEFKDLLYEDKETHYLSLEEDKSVKEHLKDLGYI